MSELGVKVGQVWTITEKHYPVRRVRVIMISGERAVVQNVETNLKTRIQLRRFRKGEGFELVEQAA